MDKSSDEINRLRKENQQLREQLENLQQSTLLKESEYRIYDSSPTGIIIVGDEYKIEYVNQVLADIFNLEIEELLGSDFRNSLSDKNKTLLSSRYQERKSGKPVPSHYEFSIEHKDGTEHILEIISATMQNASGELKTIAQIVDITDKKKAERDLAESELRYRTLINNSPDGIVLSDLQGNFIALNKKFLELHHFESLDEIKSQGYNVFDLVDEADRQLAWDNANLTLTGKLSGSLYYTLLRKDGSKYPAEIKCEVIKNLQGEPYTFVNIIRDITNRKEAERELMESQAFISAIANLSPVLISVFDLAQMKQIYINDTGAKMLGFRSAKEFLTLDSESQFGLLHPDDLEINQNHVKEIISGNSKLTYERTYRLQHKNKNYLVFKSFERPFQYDSTGKVERIIGVSVDITEQQAIDENLKRTSSRLSNMMLAANDGSWDWELATDKVIFDPRYYQMAGYEVDEFPYRLEEFQARVHPDDIAHIMHEADLHLHGKLDRFIVEFRFMRKNKTWMWIMSRGIIIERDNNGAPLRLMGTHTDISEMKEIQGDLEEAKNKAEESDRLKSAFLANMSHEIRTPMNGILGFADLLSTEDLSKKDLLDYVSIIKESGARMLNTINDIIDISKIEAGQTEIIRSKANVNNHLSYLQNFFLPEANKKGLALKFVKSYSDQKALIVTDHSKLIAILTNLLKNSIKFTDAGEISFGYKLGDKELIFYVSDTGIGISKERQSAIFDRFVQADLTITKAYEGSGLGLSLSKGFVDILGGKIWLESEIGKGSTFYFTLPDTELKNTDGLLDHVENDIPKSKKMKNLTILIVEDDESASFYLNELLKSKCKKIINARNGREAVEICKNDNLIGLILMDIKLPLLDGYEATRQIREFNKKVPIIGQTAYALVGDRSKVLEAGCNDYLVKPIDRNELFNVINKHI